MDLLRLESLKRAYGERLALEADGISLPPGAVGLLGPNGAGKSTLVQILMGLLPPSSGRAEVLGLDVVSHPLAVRARVGYMSENECFIPGLRAVDHVALAGEVGGMPRRQAHRRAHEVLGCLGVDESRYRRVEELSTGVKQRVALAAGSRLLSSSMTSAQGVVEFPRLTPGEYTVRVPQEHVETQLVLRAEGATP